MQENGIIWAFQFLSGMVDPKFMLMCQKVDHLIEQLSKIGYAIIARISLPVLVVPRAVYSFYQYFTTDLGNNAFELSLPMW